MPSAVTTEERKFQRGIFLVKHEKSGHYYMSGIYNIGLFVVALRAWSSGQVLVFFSTHTNSTRQYHLNEL